MWGCKEPVITDETLLRLMLVPHTPVRMGIKGPKSMICLSVFTSTSLSNLLYHYSGYYDVPMSSVRDFCSRWASTSP